MEDLDWMDYVVSEALRQNFPPGWRPCADEAQAERRSCDRGGWRTNGGNAPKYYWLR